MVNVIVDHRVLRVDAVAMNTVIIKTNSYKWAISPLIFKHIVRIY